MCHLTAEMLLLMGLVVCPAAETTAQTMQPPGAVKPINPVRKPIPHDAPKRNIPPLKPDASFDDRWPPPPPPPPPPLRPPTRFPPPEYDRPYAGKLTVTVHETLWELKEVCSRAGHNVLACANVAGDGSYCNIHIPQDHVIARWGWTRDDVMRHELGHCNGWLHEKSSAPAAAPQQSPDQGRDARLNKDRA